MPIPSKQWILPVLTIVIGIFFVNGWSHWRESLRPPTVVSVFSGDSILAPSVDKVTELSGFPVLRKTHLNTGDIEVRIWRGFGLSALEAVFVSRVDGKWSCVHLKEIYDDLSEDGGWVKTKVTWLDRPVSGWEPFADKIVDKGLIQLPLSPEDECDRSGQDGTSYFVEIDQDQIYRNYYYQMGDGTCRESARMWELGETISLEFILTNERCTNHDEWFGCAMRRQSERNATSGQKTPL